MSASILVVDDERVMREALQRLLSLDGYDVAVAVDGDDALRSIPQRGFDLIVSDICMPGLNGLQVLERARAANPRVGVILISGYATMDTAIEALRLGANDFLPKPFEMDDLRRSVARVLRTCQVAESGRSSPALSARPRGQTLVGETPTMVAVRAHIARCATTPSNVLITGESGVGKELVAAAIHAASTRSDGPFIPVNCGAIPETLIESQLFGHVRGAFTNALSANPGLFLAAEGGTLFLDEIGELPPTVQVKLLRVIEDRQVWPLGATKAIPVDVRIIASTNRDLPIEVKAGRFREDLFYRLNVVQITLPPLRERRGDIPLLVRHLMRRLNAKLRTAFIAIDPDAVCTLVEQPWKGNVRELENVLERAMVLGGGQTLSLRHFATDAGPPGAPLERGLRDALRQFERRHVRDVLSEVGFDKREAARLLRISLASLYRKLAMLLTLFSMATA
jgi:two-component system response regulator PilR (NtrC family)